MKALYRISFRMLSLLILSGCMLGLENSNQQTPAKKLSTTATTFDSVKPILSRYCFSCHANYSQYLDTQWIEQGLVVPGNPANSVLFNRLNGAGLGVGLENMPQTGPALNSNDLQIIKKWILGISVPNPTSEIKVDHTAVALQIIAKACASCHATVQTASSLDYQGTTVPAFSTYSKDSDFVIRGLVVPGNSGASWLYRALKGYGDLGLMPNYSAPLTSEDGASLKAWIDSMDH